MVNSVFVVDACRTPIGKIKGALDEVRPDHLAADIITALTKRNSWLDVTAIEDVYFGGRACGTGIAAALAAGGGVLRRAGGVRSSGAEREVSRRRAASISGRAAISDPGTASSASGSIFWRSHSGFPAPRWLT